MASELVAVTVPIQDIGDFAGGIVAMSCSEDTIVLIPFQRILTKISHRLSQIRDVGGVSGDIGGIRRHGIVGGFELRAVNGIGAASRQVAILNVGDFAGGLGAMSCREYTIVLIPFQRILTKDSVTVSVRLEMLVVLVAILEVLLAILVVFVATASLVVFS